MPLHEYQCDNGHRFELIRKFSDPPLEACPTCGSPVHKLISSPAFQFKGSGWYVTDYAKKEGATGKSASESSSSSDDKKKSETSSSDTTKAESAPAATPSTAATSDSKKA